MVVIIKLGRNRRNYLYADVCVQVGKELTVRHQIHPFTNEPSLKRVVRGPNYFYPHEPIHQPGDFSLVQTKVGSLVVYGKEYPVILNYYTESPQLSLTDIDFNLVDGRNTRKPLRSIFFYSRDARDVLKSEPNVSWVVNGNALNYKNIGSLSPDEKTLIRNPQKLVSASLKGLEDLFDFTASSNGFRNK